MYVYGWSVCFLSFFLSTDSPVAELLNAKIKSIGENVERVNSYTLLLGL